MKGNIRRPGFNDLDTGRAYESPYRAEQRKRAAVKGMVCHLGEVVVHEEEVVTI